ncbi:hypothetical protein [Gluconobacter oxydans]|uniref:Uncharacterized protein n=1 Tax=Gluconobacter oxydans TaxID=442 RepID=A0AB35AR13_GLUOY|nr:hypothetical protein [Gluconobacter oxydans]MBF0857347.1 hypothetical protein [Gluconobacter oxydans]MCP1249774.1 hypothetical protein [Gluconobacter oxydans]WKE47281.1 hypothetical protein NUJ38_07855 [Gluconobacter oxydans]
MPLRLAVILLPMVHGMMAAPMTVRPFNVPLQSVAKQVEGSKNRWLMRLARDFRLLAI